MVMPIRKPVLSTFHHANHQWLHRSLYREYNTPDENIIIPMCYNVITICDNINIGLHKIIAIFMKVNLSYHFNSKHASKFDS